MDYDRTDMAASYDAGRGHGPATLGFWLDAVAGAAPEGGVSSVLDLGCGTGRFSGPLADRLGARVTAIDPSESMLAQARAKPHPRVVHALAGAEAMPVADASVDMIFVSMAFHHFTDRDRAVSECRRALRPGGRVAMRALTTERIESYPIVPFFPGLAELMRETFQSVAEIEETFERGGFRIIRHDVLPSPLAASWAECAERVALRAYSTLGRLGDREFEAGLSAMRRAAAARPGGEPVIEPVDFFVFERPPAFTRYG